MKNVLSESSYREYIKKKGGVWMTAGIYTDEQLFELGKENYDKLA